MTFFDKPRAHRSIDRTGGSSPKLSVWSYAIVLAALIVPSMCGASPTISSLEIPGDARFVNLARDVLSIQADYSPDFASSNGLFDDARGVPSYAPDHVKSLLTRLQRDQAALKHLPWRRWPVDRQIDVRWIYANAQRMERELSVEKLYLHRPASWLEPLANSFIAILTYAPERHDLLDAITPKIPAMVDEIDHYCQPTAEDVSVARPMVDGLVAILSKDRPEGADAAIAALNSLSARLGEMKGLASFKVIGAENYAWRLRHASLLPWTPDELLGVAQSRLSETDAEISQLETNLPAALPLSHELQEFAISLDQPRLLALYDRIQEENRTAVEKAGFVTIPDYVGAVKARVTPDAVVPLTGDGGSMNQPPTFVDDNTNWWNVEHFNPQMSLDDRLETVRAAAQYRENGMGPYAAHEGIPGHALQLSIARKIPDPLRSLFEDTAQVEGWALYAEKEMWDNGGLGTAPAEHVAILKSWRFRIRRVVYDVNVETGRWSLQTAADWSQHKEAGAGVVGPEVRRSINWPVQLIGYFAGREQIERLKIDFKKKLGQAYSERRFNDELLAIGSVPYVFARAKMLGEKVPDF